MFERSGALAVDDAVSCADALVASIRQERRVIAERFLLVATWADLHSPETEPFDPGAPMTAERRRRHADHAESCVAAEGTPRVSRAGVVELGTLLGTSTGSAQALLRDVLELRHRLPRHWAAVQELKLDGWKGRKVAAATHGLSCAQARRVDAEVLDAVTGLAWGRAADVIEGRVIAADPVAHAARLAEDENRRFVSTRRRSNTAGLRTIIARGHAGDIARLEAMISHLADQLEAAGDTTTPLDFRRAKALAMLANPALTCVFLARADTDTSAEPGSAQGALLDAAETLMPQDEQGTLPSAVELAVAFGHLFQRLGTKVIDRLRPKSVLYLHLAAEAVQGAPGTGVARVDDPLAGGPISINQLKQWLRHDRVTVRPVIDPTDIAPISGYEVPTDLREASTLINPIETFPWGTQSSRQADQDHPVPYVRPDEGGPPGQTALSNLGPLGRTHHLAKTFDGFAVHQPALGLYLWRTPTGHWYQVDHRGTRPLGRYPADQRPAALDIADKLDPTPMSPLETRLRDLLVRHHAA